MKKMTTGSDLKINDIGSPLLHKHHKVDVEDAGNGFARSKVKDQLFIDHLLIKDLINVDEHLEAERVIGLAVGAQVYLKSPSMNQSSFGSGKPDMMSSGLMRYSRYMRWVIDNWGLEGEQVITLHVIDDVHTNDFAQISLLRKVLSRN